MNQKTCSSCKRLLPEEAFGKNRTKAGGLCGVCLTCARRASKDSYQRHRARRQKEAQAGYQKNAVIRRRQAAENKKNHVIRYRFYHKRARCKQRGIPFNITLPTFVSLHETGICSACGVVVTHAHNSRTAWSLDRLIPSMGYVSGNVCVLCRRCNTIKNDGDIPALERVLSYMKKSLQTEALSAGAGI